MTLLAFVSDPHVDDYRSRVDPATGLNAAFVDSLGVLRWAAQDAHQRGCDALVMCGDLTEQRRPAPWRVAMIKDALAEYPGPIHLLRGNHDQLTAGRSIVDVLAESRRGWHGYSRPGVAKVGDIALAFLPHVDRHWLRTQPGFESTPDADVYRALADQIVAIAQGLYVEASQLAATTILVTHLTLSGGRMSESQQAFLGDVSLVVDTGALKSIGYDAVIAGHLHEHQVLSADPLVAYVGSTHYVDFGEKAQKGYLVVDTDKLPAFEFVPTPARRFVTLTGAQLDIAGQLDKMLTEVVVRDAIVRVLDVPAGTDTADIRRRLEQAGAFEVADIRALRETAAVPSGGLSEGLTPQQAVASYFEGDEDASALLERANAVLVEAA